MRLVGLVCAAVGAHLLAAHALGDTLFLAALLLFAWSLMGRFGHVKTRRRATSRSSVSLNGLAQSTSQLQTLQRCKLRSTLL